MTAPARLEHVRRVMAPGDLRACRLHAGALASSERDSDLDLALPADQLPVFCQALREAPGVRLVQVLQHEATCFYFVLACEDQSALGFETVDVATDYRRDGRIFLRPQELMGDRQKVDGWWVAGPSLEYAYLLIKRVCKGRIQPQHLRRLAHLRTVLRGDAARITSRLFGNRWAEAIARWVDAADAAALHMHLPDLKTSLRREVLRHDRLNAIRYWRADLPRRWGRWKHPTGLFVAVLGCDGVGKSTLIEQLRATLAPAFRATQAFHFRPAVLRWGASHAAPGADPHARPPHGLLMSVAKALALYADFLFGYVLRIRPALVRSTLVVSDRYYDDLLVDPLRYRYGGPARLVRWLGRWLPRPDLYLILDAPEDRLRARKQELDADELRRQRQRYLEQAAARPAAVVIDGAASQRDVLRECSRVILGFMEDRCAQRVVAAPARDRRSRVPHAGHSQITHGVVALPGGRALVVPRHERAAAVSAVDLYDGRTLPGRVGRHLLKAGLRSGLVQPFLPPWNDVPLTEPPVNGTDQESLLGFLGEVLGERHLVQAMWLGRVGRHRKLLWQLMKHDGRVVAYAKIGRGAFTNASAEREAAVLQSLARVQFSSLVLPKVIYAGRWHGHFILVTEPAGEGRREEAETLEGHHLKALQELRDLSISHAGLQDSAFWRWLSTLVDRLPRPDYEGSLRRGMQAAITRFAGKVLPFSLCHGDFTPWNMKRTREGIFLADWEDALESGPAGYDALHYWFTTRRLLRRWSALEICRGLDAPAPPQVRSLFDSVESGQVPRSGSALLYALVRLAREASLPRPDPETCRFLSTTLSLLSRG